MHGDDDQIVPYPDAGVRSAELIPSAQLNQYKGYPHGTLTLHADELNEDMFAFIQDK